jgi:hypothetical protein
MKKSNKKLLAQHRNFYYDLKPVYARCRHKKLQKTTLNYHFRFLCYKN